MPDQPTEMVSSSTIFDLRLPASPAVSPSGHLVAFQVIGSDEERDANTSSIWHLDLATGTAAQLCDGHDDSQPTWVPQPATPGADDASAAAPTLSFLRTKSGTSQVWTCVIDGQPVQLTTVPGRVQRFAWSPCGRFLAVSLDAGPDAAAPGGMISTRSPLDLVRYGYQRDGRSRYGYPCTDLGVWDVERASFTQLTSRHDVTSFAWSPDSSTVAFCAVPLDDEDLTQPTALFTINPIPDRHGQPATPQPELVWAPRAGITGVSWHPNASQLVAVASDERPHVFDYLVTIPASPTLRTASGSNAEIGTAPAVAWLSSNLDRNLMPGETGYPGIAPILASDHDTIFFTARDQGCTVLYALRDGVATHLFGGDGVVVTGAARRPTGELVLTVRTPDSFGELIELDPGSRTTRDLFTPGRGYTMASRAERWFTTSDGLKVQGWFISPPNTKLGSPPPLLVDVHGGPHNAWNGAADEIHLYHQDLAQRGWAVLILNPRGSDGYGHDFSSGGVGGWGTKDHRDILEPIDQLVAAAEADPERLAITGYSYGGFMACFLTSRDHRFRAAVAGGVVTDLRSWVGTAQHGHYSCVNELGGYPWEDPAAYEAMSPSSQVQAVQTPTLILQGEDDLGTPLPQAILWHTFLVGNNVPSELVVYPCSSHNFNFNGTPAKRLDYSRRLTAWLVQWVEHPTELTRGEAGLADSLSDATES